MIFAKLRYDIVRTSNEMGPAAFLSVSLKYSFITNILGKTWSNVVGLNRACQLYG